MERTYVSKQVYDKNLSIDNVLFRQGWSNTQYFKLFGVALVATPVAAFMIWAMSMVIYLYQ